MLNVNYIISYLLYLVVMAILGAAVRTWNNHSKQILAFKAKEEDRAVKVLGQQNYNRAKQIVVETVYKVEQLANENLEESWTSLDKHAKALEFISEELNKVGLKLSDEDIFSIIKTTVGMLNVGKANRLN